MDRKSRRLMMVAAPCLILLAAAGLLAQHGHVAGAQEKSAVEQTKLSKATPILLQYQGRLTDPGTGLPVADGSYTMVLRLYGEPSGGKSLWAEAKDVPVRDGLFSTVLGDTTPLDQGLFNGSSLWLAVKVGADEEAAPRQQVLPVAYALSLVPGSAVQAKSAKAALTIGNSGTGPALQTSGSIDV